MKNINIFKILVVSLAVVVLVIYFNNPKKDTKHLSKTEDYVVNMIGKEINLIDSLSVYDIKDDRFYDFKHLKLNKKK